jgi:hypothetical protein
LKPTNIVTGRDNRIHRLPPSPDRWKERSRTFAGIAAAMAQQFSEYIERNRKGAHADGSVQNLLFTEADFQ